MTIPRLAQAHGLEATYLSFLEALPAAGFRGDVQTDYATRLSAATDNSIYQVLPQAVVFPRSAQDVEVALRLLSEERFRAVRLSPRGGGTGTNGQSLTDGVVLDVSRHMRRVLEVNLREGWARVEPGVVLDQLNEAVAPYGVFFAPNLSPSNRATLGGMINTDACGEGSRVYGRTSDHLLALDTVLLGGQRWTSTPLDRAGLEAAMARDDRAGQAHRTLHAITTEHQALIAQQFPKLQRFMTGYNLALVADPDAGRFDLNYLLAGSEGTLGVVVEAKVRLTKLPAHKQLVVLKYTSFDDALGSARLVAESDPSAIETVDEKILRLAREDILWHRVAPMVTDAPDAPTRAINLVQFTGDDAAAVRAKVDALTAAVDAHRGGPRRPTGYYVAQNAGEIAVLWELRKKGVGLLGNAPGPRKPVPFVEDTVVPPERLADYIAEFRAILDEAGLEYGMFGHVDVGCLHVRPALDLKQHEDERLLQTISDQVATLVRKYGGVMWGEHGRGYRAQYGPDFFGPVLYEQLRRVKAAFDPFNQLNPGKIATAQGTDLAVVPVDGPRRGQQDRQVPAPVRQKFAVAIDCNGNGACFDYSTARVMCPSYKETVDRIHSPKGRATVMREWLRQLAVAGFDPLAQRRARLGDVFRKWGAALARRFGAYDYSHEVYAAMDGCLACKACATQCPVKVDVPDFRAEFYDLYHRRYPRPLRDHFVAGLERVLAPMSRAPSLFNLFFDSRAFRWLLAKTVGIVDAPRLSAPTLSARLHARGLPPFDPAAIRAADEVTRARSVVLLQDAFTTYYEAPVVEAVHDLLTALGYQVHVAPMFENGKALHVKGFMSRFRGLVRRNAQRLRDLSALGLPLVGVDPAVVLTYRAEYPKALGEAPDFRVHLLQEWLAAELDKGATPRPPAVPAPPAVPFQLFGHCTEKALAPKSQDQWRQVFAAFGLDLQHAPVGCCGMSGVYGHEAIHQTESRGLFDKAWAPVLAKTQATPIADGYSCRSQTKRFGGQALPHPAQALLAALRPPG